MNQPWVCALTIDGLWVSAFTMLAGLLLGLLIIYLTPDQPRENGRH